MDVSISAKNRLGIAQMISTINSGEPNWSVIPTAGKRNKSQAQFVSEIKDLAKKAAMAANKTESEYISGLGLKTVYCFGKGFKEG